MSSSLKNSYNGQIGTSNTTVYTCPSNTVARVIKCLAVNDTTSDTAISAHVVPSGGSPGDDNISINDRTLNGKEAYECPEIDGQVLEAGETINFIADDANQVTLHLSVAEIV